LGMFGSITDVGRESENAIELGLEPVIGDAAIGVELLL